MTASSSPRLWSRRSKRHPKLVWVEADIIRAVEDIEFRFYELSGSRWIQRSRVDWAKPGIYRAAIEMREFRVELFIDGVLVDRLSVRRKR